MTYTPRNLKLADLWSTIELHVTDHGELPKRLGKCIKGLGGTYTATRGHSTKRFVTVPAHARRTIEDIYAMFRVECAILRGATQLLVDLHGGQRIADHVIRVPKGADPLTVLYADERNYTAAEWGLAESVRAGREQATAATLLERAAQARAGAVAKAAPAMLAALQVIARTPTLRALLDHVDQQALAQVDAAITAATGELTELPDGPAVGWYFTDRSGEGRGPFKTEAERNAARDADMVIT